MANFGKLVDEVIEVSDILLLIIDARNIKDSINENLEKQIEKSGKRFLYVINKCDLLSKKEQDKLKLPNSIQVSASKHMSTMRLLRKIMEISKGENAVVGVIGYPNTGKSTIINALKGRHSAPTSSKSGFTRSIQKVKISNKLTLIDTPGVFGKSLPKNGDVNHVMIGAIDSDKIKDKEEAVLKLIEKLDGKIERYYKVKPHEDSYDTLEEIAIKNNMFKKGKEPDTQRMAASIIQAWQKGKIKDSNI